VPSGASSEGTAPHRRTDVGVGHVAEYAAQQQQVDREQVGVPPGVAGVAPTHLDARHGRPGSAGAQAEDAQRPGRRPTARHDLPGRVI
jgi:hypothetical protein